MDFPCNLVTHGGNINGSFACPGCMTSTELVKEMLKRSKAL